VSDGRIFCSQERSHAENSAACAMAHKLLRNLMAVEEPDINTSQSVILQMVIKSREYNQRHITHHITYEQVVTEDFMPLESEREKQKLYYLSRDQDI
jgi:RNA 3'-terminal phosphate cyclase